MTEYMYEESQGEDMQEWQQQQAMYYQNNNYAYNQQPNYYYQNGYKYQNGGGNYYRGNADNYQENAQDYAKYGGQYYQNQQYAEQYGNYGALMLNNGMNFYYNRGYLGDWITRYRYREDEWERYKQGWENQYDQVEGGQDYQDYYQNRYRDYEYYVDYDEEQEKYENDYADYYAEYLYEDYDDQAAYYRRQRYAFAQSGIADVCGALYTYAAKCNKHLANTSNNYKSKNAFDYSFGVSFY